VNSVQGTGAGFVGCAVGTVSYLARARVLAESWRRHHPGSPFFVLLIDGDDWPQEGEPFEVVLPTELGLTAEELAVRRGIYDAYEMATSLKARLSCVLLDRGTSAVVFADTDSSFYGAVDDLALTGMEAGVVLFPHSTRPVQVRRYFPAGQIEYGRLTNGLFNTGLQVTGPAGRAYLDWWDGWLARDSLKESAAGLWADQIWADWAPVYFDHTVVRDSSVNVAFWNLDERELHEVDNRPAVDGAPLRHFHFAGFDPRRPDILSTYVPDVSPPSNPALVLLLQQYADRLHECGDEELRKRPYGYGVSAGGRALTPHERAIYREFVLAAEARGTDLPPNPFDASRMDDFERLVEGPTALRSLSPQARQRLERVRPPGLSRSSFARATRRLSPALRYAVTEQPLPGREITARIASDAVRAEY
jgi:hypothetical protein